MVGAAGRGLVGAGGEVFATQKISHYIKKMATDGGGGGVGGLAVTTATAKIGPGFEFFAKIGPGFESPKRGCIYFS